MPTLLEFPLIPLKKDDDRKEPSWRRRSANVTPA